MKLKNTVLGLSLACLLVACNNEQLMKEMKVPSGMSSGELLIQPDTYPVNELTYPSHSGVLIVPENRSNPNTRQIEIPFIQIHATGEEVGDPIFFLNGGPGNANIFSYKFVDNLIEHHDIVLVGFRGVEGSVTLTLNEIDEFFANMPGDLTEMSTLEAMASAYAKGARRLQREGIDTDGYTITEVLSDIDLVREKLGYKNINLLSVSYGTRLAMIYDWMFPGTVNRSAMISVNPPGRFEWRPEVMDQHLKYYAELYKNDVVNGNPDIDIAEIIRKNSRKIPDSWMLIPIKKGNVLMSTFMMLYSTATAPQLFDAWIAADQGDWSGIALLSKSMDMMIAGAMLWGDLASKAASADYDFGQDMNLMDEFMPENSIIGAPGTLLGIGALGWPANLIPDSLRKVNYSETNTLLINGNIDVSTPEQFGRLELLPQLKNGTQVLISEAAHSPDIWGNQRPALDHMLKVFFKTGIVDDSKYEYQPMNFEVGISFQTIAKLILGGILLIVILIGFTFRFIFRRIHRKKRLTNESPTLATLKN